MTWCLLPPLVACSSALAADRIEVRSPDGNVALGFCIRDDAKARRCLIYSVSYKGKPVVLDSRLGLALKDAPPLAGDFELVKCARGGRDATWRPVYGERNSIPDRYNEAVVDLRERTRGRRRLRLTLRAYDEGAAFRYTIPKQPGVGGVTITSEDTHFAFAAGTFGYVTSSAQGKYSRVALAKMRKESERPLTVELANGLVASVGEAGLVDYARMRLRPAKGRAGALKSALAGHVTGKLPLATPWRVVMVGERPGDLIENNHIFLNLNPPCAIEDPSWIRPGKVIREVTLSTAGGKACVDFAVEHNLQYVEYDAGWYGHEYDDRADATTVSVDPKRNPRRDLDLPAVLEYARRKGVGILLYVNRRALERQLDAVLPLYRKWGVKGLKYGFVRVGSQKWTKWLHEAVRKAARYNMLVDIHDEYRPTGFSRTYPNLMTQEGIRGNECMPSATSNVTMPFTRFLCGAADYTICYYCDRIKTTHAHQLALAVAFYSPLQFVFWYDRPSACRGEPEIELFERVPTVWDDTRVIHGEIGRYISIARRSGREWYVGILTNTEARRLEVPLGFLDAGRKYLAHVYSDGGPEVGTRTRVKIERFIVGRSTVVRAGLSGSGGQAMRIVPATAADLRRHPPYRTAAPSARATGR